MKTTCFFISAIILLSGCGQDRLSKEEIEKLCQDIGTRAYYDPKVGAGSDGKAAEAGAIAECKLKYMTGR